MNSIRAIRTRLGITQAQLAAALSKTQGNVAFYERGQVVPPAVAKQLIVFAGARGVVVTLEEIYGDVPAIGEGAHA